MTQNTNNLSQKASTLSPTKRALLALQEMQTKLNALESAKTEPIAIIGMGCRFPGGVNNPDEFWQLLREGKEGITEIPSERWNIDAYYDSNPDAPGKMSTRYGGFLDAVDKFDAAFFGISPREAASLDPQQRLLLEVSWEALEQANQVPAQLFGSATGVFVGMTGFEYGIFMLGAGEVEQIDAYAGTGVTLGAAAGRLSYVLGLTGPSFILDTACSSSLLTLHLACHSLRQRECDLALVGGVNLLLGPEAYINFSKAGMLAADGRCKTFDSAADGYSRGEGCGVVVLKRQSDAVADGDNILALVRGSAVNQDGPSGGLTVPSGPSQVKVIRQALANAGVTPEQVSYIEAHGTGTSLGDPIEIGALGNVFGSNRSQDNPLIVGSVKTNVGHLEAAAGVASLIKVVLSLQHQEIPPHLHFKQPNPHIDWDVSPVVIPTERQPWTTVGTQQRIAGVSSFSFTGTNVHIVLEEPPTYEKAVASTSNVKTLEIDHPVARPKHLLTLSAKTEESLTQLVKRYDKHLSDHPDLTIADISFTANTARSHLKHRLAIVADSTTELTEKFSAFTAEQTPLGWIQGTKTKSPKIVFLFTGQGSQYIGMGQALYETQPTFRQTLERCDDILRDYLEQPLLEILYPTGVKTENRELHNSQFTIHNSQLNKTVYTQPALFALEYALAELWQSWGLKPAVVMGHSIGEYVAACVAGVFSLEEGLKLVAERARLMQSLPEKGEMVAVFADEATVTAAIAAYTSVVSIAAFNEPNNIVISGEAKAIQSIVVALESAGIETRKLTVSHAFHSPLMEPMLAGFERVANGVSFQKPKIPLVSNVTGQILENVPEANYWREHTRSPVKFVTSVKTLFEQGYDYFLEIGPKPVLSKLGQGCQPNTTSITWLPSLKPKQADWHVLLNSLATLYVQGADINWATFEQDYPRNLVSLPTYPFQGKRYWLPQTKSTRLEMKSVEQTAPSVEQSSPQDSVNAVSRKDTIVSLLRTLATELLQIASSEIDVDIPLLEMGADSIVMAQAVRQIENTFGLSITIRQFFEELTTLNALANYIEQHISPELMLPSADKKQATVVESQEQSKSLLPMDTGITTTSSHAERVSETTLERMFAQQVQAATQASSASAMEAVSQVVSQQLAFLDNNQATTAGSMPPIAIPPKSSTPIAAKSQSNSFWGKASGAVQQAKKLSVVQQQHLDALIARYTQRTQQSKQQEQNYRPAFADMRASLGFRMETKEMCYPIIAQSSQGSKLWDIDGNEYIDITLGFGVHLFGHQPEFITTAIEAQLKQGMQLGPQSNMAGEVAKLISELTGMQRVTFCNSGTEAVMTALRIARAATNLQKIALFSGSYHGHFDGTLAVASTEDPQSGAVPMAPGVLPNMVDNVIVLPYGTPQALKTIKACANELAAVLVEPVQSRRPDLQPQAFLEELRQMTEASGTALIFDEMITGFRTHPGGTQAWFGIEADIVTYGKVIGGGMPLGVVAGKADYMARIDGGVWHYGDDSYPEIEKTFYAGTFCKHPLTMATSLAVLKHLKTQGATLQQRLNQRTTQLAETLNSYFKQNDIPIQVVHFGSLFRFALASNLSYVYQPLEMDLFYYHLIEKGVYTWEGRICFLSTAHTDDDIKYVINAVKESAKALQVGGFFSASSASKPPVETQQSAAEKVPLVAGQQEMWLLVHANPAASLAYHEIVAMSLQGPLEVEKLRDAVNQVVARHEALRVMQIDGEHQQIVSTLSLDIPLHDFSNLDLAEVTRQAKINQWLSAELQRPFNLEQGPLLRVYLLKQTPHSHALVIIIHHLIADGWSLGLLLHEIVAFYSDSRSLPAPVPYRQFWQWEKQLSHQSEDIAYWREQFVKPFPVLELPTDRVRPAVPSYRGHRHNAMIPVELCQALKAFSHRQGCSLFMTLLAGFNTLLARLSGEEAFVIGIPLAGHSVMGASQMVGQCTTMLPLPVLIPGESSFSAVLSATKNSVLASQEHQTAIFSKEVSLPVPAITVIFNLDRPAFSQFADLQMQLLPSPIQFVKFDLFLNVLETDGQLSLFFDYSRDLLDEKTVHAWADDFLEILQEVIEQPEISISALLPHIATHRPTSPLRVQGYRVNLAEITAVLMQHPAVKQAVVTVHAETPAHYEATLIAYVVLETHLPIREIRLFLKEKLPAYKIPHYFSRITTVPQTPAGEIDYKALTALKLPKETGTGYVAPRNANEAKLAELWHAVLGIENVSVKDNFFELGGNSLKAVQLLNRISQVFGIEFSLREFFEAPTIAKLAILSQHKSSLSRHQPIPLIPLQADYELSHAQKRLWMLEQMEENLVAYNIPVAVKMSGELEVSLLKNALQDVMQRHDSLRTTFIDSDDGTPRQKIAQTATFDLEVIDLTQTQNAEKQACTLAEQDALIPFDLARGPLLRVKLCKLPVGSLLAFTIHHIISDVWSLALLSRELFTLYEAYRTNQDNPLPPLTIQYKDYSAWQNTLLQSAEMTKHQTYWHQKLAAPLTTLALPTDHSRPVVKTYHGAGCRFSLDRLLTAGLRTISLQNQASLFMVLVATIKVLLYKYTHQEDIILGTVTAGRDHPALTDQIGFYVNALVLRDQVKERTGFADLLKQVRQTMLEAYEHQIYPFDRLVEELVTERELSRNPFFEVMIVMDDRDEIRQISQAFALTEMPLNMKTSQFDLTWYITEQPDTIDFYVVYNTDLFEPATLAQLWQRFQLLVTHITDAPDSAIADLDWLPSQGVLPPIQPMASKEPLRLSAHQERLWFVDQFETGQIYASHPVYYNMPLLMLMTGTLNTVLLQDSLNQLVTRHTALRTYITPDEQHPCQVIQSAAFLELRIAPKCATEEQAIDQALTEIQTPFDLLKPTLLVRAALIPIATEAHLLVVTVHHILADLYSLGLLTQELAALYNAQVQNQPLPPPPLQFADFVQWQRALPPQLLEPQRIYWQKQLAGLSALELPTDRPRPAIHTYTSGLVPVTLPVELSKQLSRFAEQEQVSLSTLLLTAFHILLHRYAQQDDIVTGIPTTRHSQDTQSVVGALSNLLVLRTNCSEQPSFRTLIAQVQKNMQAAIAHQDLPFDEVVIALHPKNDMSRTALFDVMFQYQDFMTAPDMSELQVRLIHTNLGWGKYDLNLCWYPSADGLAGTLSYNRDIYDATTMERLLGHHHILLEDAINHPDKPIAQLSLLTKTEQNQLLYSWNEDVKVGYPTTVTLQQLFEAQVKRTPENIALVLENQTLSYAELNCKANQLAHYLRQQNVSTDVLVGVCLERSFDLIIALLGILKAGGAYVPMDPDYPQERLQFMCQDAALSIVITKGIRRNLFAHQDINIIDLADQTIISKQNTENPAPINTPQHLAYIIYTSGSTGTPKGAMIEHRNVVRLLFNDKSLFQFNEQDVWTLFHSYCFDFSVWEMYGALLFGGKLVIVPKSVAQEAVSYWELLKQQQVTVLNQTPTAFYALIQADLATPEPTLAVKSVIFGGEALKPALLKPWYARYPGTRLINMYGITETTVHVTYKEITEVEIASNLSNIGQPIPTLSAYILDSEGQLMPLGVAGELCIGGAGVGRGYLNRDTLTAEKFIPNPYNPEERLYKSGDLAKRLPNGELVYLDRIDNQVKIRGFRVELGEIENRLLSYPSVQEAVVMAMTDESNQSLLRAYLVTRDTLAVEELRHHLSQTLPDYMVPTEFVQIEQMPLTSNGKVDRKRLANLTGQRLHLSAENYAGPRNRVEETLVKLWEEILEHHPIGIYDNFFDLGGHSLKATQVVSRIHKNLDKKITLKAFFSTPTIADIAQLLQTTTLTSTLPPIEPAPLQDDYALSYAQRRLWTLDQMAGQSTAYNMFGAFLLSGALNVTAFKQSFVTLVERHESLRTTFITIAGTPRQKIHPKIDLTIEEYDLSHQQDSDTAVQSYIHQELNTPFDLAQGPLLRIKLLKLNPDQPENHRYVFLVNLHHIISDGVSIMVLVKELLHLYKAYTQGDTHSLLPLRIHYKDYAAWQGQLLASEEGEKHKDYWQQKFADEIPVLNLPTDYPRPALQTQHGDALMVAIDPQVLLQLNQMGKVYGASLFMVLLSAVNAALFCYTSQEDIIVGIPIAGRNHPDLEEQIGFYVNTLPLRVQFNGDNTWAELLEKIKQTATEAYTHQDYPFDKLVEELALQRDRSRNPLFDILVNMPNQALKLDLEGVTVSPFLEESVTSKFDLNFTFSEQPKTLQIRIEYNTDLFKPETIQKIGEELVVLLKAIVDNPNQTLIALKGLLTSVTKAQEQADFLATTMELDEDF